MKFYIYELGSTSSNEQRVLFADEGEALQAIRRSASELATERDVDYQIKTWNDVELVIHVPVHGNPDLVGTHFYLTRHPVI